MIPGNLQHCLRDYLERQSFMNDSIYSLASVHILVGVINPFHPTVPESLKMALLELSDSRGCAISTAANLTLSP